MTTTPRRRPRLRRLHRPVLWAVLLLPPLLNGCTGSPSYSKDHLPEAVQDLCRREYGLAVDAHLAGKTLYVSCPLDGLVGPDLDLQRDTLDKLEGAMLSSTRVALSTDADLNFIALLAHDTQLGVRVTLLRYLPDIKSLIYMRISRTDFEDRLVMETDNAAPGISTATWADIPMTGFWARLAASRLQRQFSANPLVSTFLNVRSVQGTFEDNKLILRLDKYDEEPGTTLLVDEILQGAAEKIVADVVNKYDAAGIIHRMVLQEGDKVLLTREVEALLKEAGRKKEAAAENGAG